MSPRANGMAKMAMAADAPGVTEKAFDDFHLYDLPRETSLRDMETKQLEFVLSDKLPTKRLYICSQNNMWGGGNFLNDQDLSVPKVPIQTVLEFENKAEANLGVPLPAGIVRVYRKDGEQVEFIGENRINHTPQKETLRIPLGTAFDLIAERKRIDFKKSSAENRIEETFEITFRNRSKKPATIQAVERLYRTANAKITVKSHEFEMKDSNTAVFNIETTPDSPVTLKYTVVYTW